MIGSQINNAVYQATDGADFLHEVTHFYAVAFQQRTNQQVGQFSCQGADSSASIEIGIN